MTARGIRNNNPGNIRITGDKWQGLLPGEDLSFFTFKDPEHGIRALAKILITYYNKHDLDRVETIINRWAPPSENDTTAYIEIVSKRLGVLPTDRLEFNIGTLELLVRAIIQHENGTQPYDDRTITDGLKLALTT